METAGVDDEWPTVRQICRVTRWRPRKVNGKWREPKLAIVHRIASRSAEEASPQVLLKFNRAPWGIEIRHRHKDVTLGEDGYTNRSDPAPPMSSLGFVLKTLKSVQPSPTRAIE